MASGDLRVATFRDEEQKKKKKAAPTVTPGGGGPVEFLRDLGRQANAQGKRLDEAYSRRGVVGVLGQAGTEAQTGLRMASDALIGPIKEGLSRAAPSVGKLAIGPEGMATVRDMWGADEPPPATAPPVASAPGAPPVTASPGTPPAARGENTPIASDPGVRSFGGADVARFEVPESGSFAGSMPGGRTFSTAPAFDPALAEQQTRIALLKKRQGFAPNEQGAAFGSEEEALRRGSGFTTIGQDGGFGLFSKSATEQRNKQQAVNNEIDLAISRAKNKLTGRERGRVIAALEQQRGKRLGLTEELPSAERIAALRNQPAGASVLDIAKLEQEQADFEREPLLKERMAVLNSQLGGQRDRARIEAEARMRQEGEAAKEFRGREAEVFGLAADQAGARNAYSQLQSRLPPNIALSLVDSVLKNDPSLTGPALDTAIKQAASNYLARAGNV